VGGVMEESALSTLKTFSFSNSNTLGSMTSTTTALEEAGHLGGVDPLFNANSIILDLDLVGVSEAGPVEGGDAGDAGIGTLGKDGSGGASGMEEAEMRDLDGAEGGGGVGAKGDSFFEKMLEATEKGDGVTPVAGAFLTPGVDGPGVGLGGSVLTEAFSHRFNRDFTSCFFSSSAFFAISLSCQPLLSLDSRLACKDLIFGETGFMVRDLLWDGEGGLMLIADDLGGEWNTPGSWKDVPTLVLDGESGTRGGLSAATTSILELEVGATGRAPN